MKRKFTFFGICVLLCTLMISLGSCQKDYSEDIDNLQNQINQNKTAVAALNQAIASGKLIKTVSAVTGGYQITFSDNTTITINHGTAGAPGAAGTPGATGAAGFTPIIGIDAAGYWTVITTQGGTPVRVKNAGGNDVRAEFSKELGVDANGMLTVGGVATTVPYSTIVYNSFTKKITITLKDENGNLVTKTIAVSEDTFLATDLTSVNAPIGETKTIISYSQVPADNAAGYIAITGNPAGTKAQAQTILTWAGTTFGGKLKSGGSLPVILNPSGVNAADYTFEVIKQDGTLFALQPSTVVSGFAGSFAAWAPGASTNLYSLNFDPGLAALTPLSGTTTYQLAVRAVKDGREVVSGYQYSVRVQAEVTTNFAPKASTAIVGGVPTAYLPIGTSKNILTYFDRTAPVPVQTLTNLDFFKSVVEKQAASINSDINPYITYDGTVIGTGTPTLTTITNVSDKTMNFDLRTFDWVGGYKVTPVDILFYGQLKTATVPTLATINHELTIAATPADQKTTTLTPMFNALQIEGKTELWRNNATDVEVIFNTAAAPNAAPIAMTGVTVEFLDASNALITDRVTFSTVKISDPLDVKDIRHIRLTFDETVVNPGAYIASLKFADRRAYANNSTDLMVVKFNVNITNPTVGLIATATDKKANVFNGQNLSIYGTAAAAPVQGAPANFYYEINKAYQNLSVAAAPLASPLLAAGQWAFVMTPPIAAGAPTAMLTSIGNGVFNFGQDIATNTTLAKPYVSYSLDLYYYYFGNVNNKVKLETITVEARSEVKDGSSEVLVPAASTGLPSTLQVTNGDLVTVRNFKPYFKVKDYLGVDLKVFDPARDVRAATVAITVPAAQAHLISATYNAATFDWDIKATNNVAVLPTAFVDIPVKLTITDLLNVKTDYTINVRVVKP